MSTKGAFGAIVIGLLATSAATAQTAIDNPVVATNAPDPGAIRVGDTYYVVTTDTGGQPGHFTIRASKDLAHFTDVGSIFPSGQPAWATDSFWAPEIHQVGDHFVCCYTARDASGKLCVGIATASSVTGPYVDSGAPVVRDPTNDKRYGVIDPTISVAADGKPYLYWKTDGNAHGATCTIEGAPLALDGNGRVAPGTNLFAQGQALVKNDQPWEGDVVEAPWVEKHGGFYYLYYTGNDYGTRRYAEGVARATSPLGPFTKLAQPILTTGNGFAGPGHVSIVSDPSGQDFLLFHAWLDQPNMIGDNSGGPGRVLLVNRVDWVNGWPVVGDDGHPARSVVGPSSFESDPGLPLPGIAKKQAHPGGGIFGWLENAIAGLIAAIEGAVGAIERDEPTPGFTGALASFGK